MLPCICPDLGYDQLEGVADGGMAQTAFLEAIDADTAPERRSDIERQLLDYCCLDTFAMVRLWQFFGRPDTPSLPANCGFNQQNHSKNK